MNNAHTNDNLAASANCRNSCHGTRVSMMRCRVSSNLEQSEYNLVFWHPSVPGTCNKAAGAVFCSSLHSWAGT